MHVKCRISTPIAIEVLKTKLTHSTNQSQTIIYCVSDQELTFKGILPTFCYVLAFSYIMFLFQLSVNLIHLVLFSYSLH